jgi:two-component system chemotaxis response regulator CheB
MASGTSKSIHALVVEHSTAGRGRIVRILQADGDICVVGQASTSAEAIRLVHDLRPDIVTLGLSLPDATGRHVVQQIVAQVPTPILLLTSDFGASRSQLVVEALAAGALEALPVPDRWTSDLEADLRRKVRLLRKVHVFKRGRTGAGQVDAPTQAGRRSRQHVVAIAASTGGPSVLATVLAGIGGTTAPVLVVQHLHTDLTLGLVSWMSRVSALPVVVAEHGQQVRAGSVYVAPGGAHLRLDADFRMELGAVPETIHRPSADELFLSVAKHAGAGAIGVVLTGMGDDGAKGLLAIQQAGGRTLAQDEASCAVYGMPAAARRLGAVTDMLPPAEIARAITIASRARAR